MVLTSTSAADVFGKVVLDIDVWDSEHSRNAALSDLPVIERKDVATMQTSRDSFPAIDLSDHEREIIDDVILPRYRVPLNDSQDPSGFFRIRKNREWKKVAAPTKKLVRRSQAVIVESPRPTSMRRSNSELALGSKDISSQVPTMSPLSRAVLKRHNSIGCELSKYDDRNSNKDSFATLESRKIQVQSLLDELSSSDSSLRRMQGSSSSLEQAREKARDELTSLSDHTGTIKLLEERRWNMSLVLSTGNQETARRNRGNGENRRRGSNSSVMSKEATQQSVAELQDELRRRDQVVRLTKSTETSYKSRRRRHLDNLLSCSDHGRAPKHTDKRRSSMGDLVHSSRGLRKLKCLDAAISSPQSSIGSSSTLSELQDTTSGTFQNDKKAQELLANFDWQRVHNEQPSPRKVDVSRSPRPSRRRQSTTDADSIISAGGAVAELKLSERNHLKGLTPNRSARRWSGTSLSSRGRAERHGISPRGPAKKISVHTVANVTTKCQELDMRF